jgi:hypothetical protein
MARDLNEMEDDNPIDEDFNDTSCECISCGEPTELGEAYCTNCYDKVFEGEEDEDDIPNDETYD